MRTHASDTFGALRNPRYRIYAIGQSISVPGTWMQKVAQALLVLQLTDSGVLLGVAAALQQGPTLFLTAWAGGLADRLDRRRLLLITQGLAAIPAVILGTLCATNTATIGLVLALAALLGCIDAIDKPVRHTFVNDLVESHEITNAVTLNNIIQNSGKVIGPALAGLVIGLFGLAAGFYVNAASYVAVLVALALIRQSGGTAHLRERGKSHLLDGIRYARSRPDLYGALILMTVSGLLAYNWTVVLPLLAQDTFGAEGTHAVGFTFTAMGVGAVLGGLAIASRLSATRTGLVVGALGFAASLALVAMAPALELAYVALLALGMSSVSFRTTANSVLQLSSAPEMRGRVIALFVLATNGTTPLGAPLAGWVCEQFGVRVEFLIAAAGTALTALWAARAMRRTPETADQPAPVGA